MLWNQLLSLVKLVPLQNKKKSSPCFGRSSAIRNLRHLYCRTLHITAHCDTPSRVSHETVKKLLKLNKFHLRKEQIPQLPFDDCDRRIEFHKTMTKFINGTKRFCTRFALLMSVHFFLKKNKIFAIGTTKIRDILGKVMHSNFLRRSHSPTRWSSTILFSFRQIVAKSQTS